MAKKNPSSTRPPQSTSVFLGLAVRERGPSGKWLLRFRFGRIVTLLVILAVAGYLAMAGIFYAIMRARGYESTTYADSLVLLFKREDFREKRALEHYENAQDAIERRDMVTAYRQLMFTVRLDPSHLEGRKLLAEFQQAFGEQDQAVETLEEGLAFAGHDREYLEAFAQMMLAAERDQQLIEAVETILESDPPEDLAQLLAFVASRAHYYRGQFDQAESLLIDHDLDEDVSGVLLIAQINWSRGLRKFAIEQLEGALKDFPSSDAIYEALAVYHREQGNLETARRYAVLRHANSPLTVGPRIGFLQVLKATGEDTRAEREANDILRQFRTESSALLALGNYATNNGDTGLMRRIYQAALEEGFDIASYALLVIECRIAAGDYAGAVEFCEQLDDESPQWLEQQAPIFNSLRSVAYYGLGNNELCELYLDRFLQGQQRSRAHSAIARRFEELGALQQARRVLEHAYERNPSNQDALTQLIALELELGNSAEVSAYLRQLLHMRRPSDSILREAHRKLSSDRFIYTPDREEILREMGQLLNLDGDQAA
ncbi:MAG: tetratricopeptide repeat protein [Opitutales bacterium]